MIDNISEGSVLLVGAHFPALSDSGFIPQGFGIGGEWPLSTRVPAPEGVDKEGGVRSTERRVLVLF